MSKSEFKTPTASEIGKEAGLLIFGAGVGLLLSEAFGSRASKPLGLILGAVGIAAAGPEITKIVTKAVNSPSNSFGSKKTLEGIRYGSGKPLESVDPLGSEDDSEMFLG